MTSNLVSVAIYFFGAYIIYRLDFDFLIIYLFYIFILEARLLKSSCTKCYYYGKFCAFGKGKLSALLFKKEDKGKLNKRKITGKDILPEFLVSIIPLFIGIWLLVSEFDWKILASMVILVILASVGSALVRGRLACKFCKQRELGCPAEQLFNKKK